MNDVLDAMKHQSNCFRTINKVRYINQCDVLDEPHFALVEKAKRLKVRHRVIKHPDGYGQLFVHPDDERLLHVNGAVANALQAEVDALRKDAERYRWLRDNVRGDWDILWDYQGEGLDQVIDSEISREKGANDNGNRTQDTP